MQIRMRTYGSRALFAKKYRGVRPGHASDRLKVAVHMRRGDVSAAESHRYTSTASLLKIIEAIRQACTDAGRECDIALHSQGQREDFMGFVDQGCELCLNAPALTSLNALIYADIL